MSFFSRFAPKVRVLGDMIELPNGSVVKKDAIVSVTVDEYAFSCVKGMANYMFKDGVPAYWLHFQDGKKVEVSRDTFTAVKEFLYGI